MNQCKWLYKINTYCLASAKKVDFRGISYFQRLGIQRIEGRISNLNLLFYVKIQKVPPLRINHSREKRITMKTILRICDKQEA